MTRLQKKGERSAWGLLIRFVAAGGDSFDLRKYIDVMNQLVWYSDLPNAANEFVFMFLPLLS